MPVRALVSAVVVASFIVLLYLLYSWFQLIVGDGPWFVDSLGMYSPLVVFIDGVGFNLIPLVIDLSMLAILVLVIRSSLPRLRGLLMRVVPWPLVTGSAFFIDILGVHYRRLDY